MRIRCAFAVALALGFAACSGDSSSTATSSTTSTTAPTATLTTATFSGTVPKGGSDAHDFTASATGTVTVTLTAASPPDGIVMGVAVGTPKDSACNRLAGSPASVAAGAGPVPGIISAGTYCVVVYDVGNQTAPVTYTVTVEHP